MRGSDYLNQVITTLTCSHCAKPEEFQNLTILESLKQIRKGEHKELVLWLRSLNKDASQTKRKKELPVFFYSGMDVWVSKNGADWKQVSDSPWNAVSPTEIKYDFAALALDGGQSRRSSIYTFGGDRETFDFTDPTNYLNVDNDVWRFAPPMLQPVRDGLADLKNRAQEKAGTASFAELSDADQKELIGSIENTPLFGLARLLTVFGLFTHPKYGGNKDKVGWNLVGIDDRHAWNPPFGHYDVDYDYEANYGEGTN